MLPEDYPNLMWFQKRDLFEPWALFTWMAYNPGKLAPSEEEAKDIRLASHVVDIKTGRRVA